MDIKSILSKVDLFAYNFSLTFFKNKKISTLYGQISSLIILIFGFFIIIFIFEDFFKQKSPNTNLSTIYSLESKTIKLKERNFFIGFRIINTDEISIDFSNQIFPVFFYLMKNKNIIDNVKEKKLQLINFSKCNSFNINKKEIDVNGFNITDFYCLNFSDLQFGDDNNYEMSYVLEFNLCQNRLNYNPKDPELINLCSKENFIKNISNYKIEILYPEIYFQPFNSSKFISMKLKNIKDNIAYNLLSDIYIFIQDNEIKDDKGLFFRKYNKDNFLSIKSIKKEYILRNSDLLIDGGSSNFLTINLIHVKDYNIYSRYHIKVSQIIVNIFVFVRLIIFIFNIFLVYFNNKIENLDIFYNIFDCSIPSKNDFQNNSSNLFNFNNSFKSSYGNFISSGLYKKQSARPYKNGNTLAFHSNKINKSSKPKSKFCTTINSNHKKNGMDSSLNFTTKDYTSSRINFNEIPNSLKKKKIYLSILSLLLKGNKSKENRRDYLFYEKVKNYILNMKDFYSLIKIGTDLGNIRYLLLTEIQNKMFSNKKKINPCNQDDMKLIIESKERDNLLFEKF